MKPIYLDNNSTTVCHPDVVQAMTECYQSGYANPASQHALGREARQVLEQARERVTALLGGRLEGTQSDYAVFTSGGTEANNLALFGLAGNPPGRIIVAGIEHPSVLEPAGRLQQQGFDVQLVRATSDGVVDLNHFAELLDEQTRLVSVMGANHETGVVQPLTEIADLCRPLAVPLHSDGVQVAGKQPIAFQESGLAALSISGHKFHGPRGSGVLLLRRAGGLNPIHWGGFQQLGLRPGTEPVALPVGLCRALEIATQQLTDETRRLAQLRDQLEASLSESGMTVVINGARAVRLAHTSNVAFPGLDRQALLMALDLAGVACSSGSACASGSSEPSTVLTAMGLPEERIGSSLRFSLGAFTGAGDVDLAARRIIQVCNDLHSKKAGRKIAPPSRPGTAKQL